MPPLWVGPTMAAWPSPGSHGCSVDGQIWDVLEHPTGCVNAAPEPVCSPHVTAPDDEGAARRH